MNNTYFGEGYVPAYQMSAIPWVTSSQVALGGIVQLNFGQVTKFLTVQNTGAANTAIAVAFTQNGLKPVNSNYFVLSGSGSYTADIRTDRIFISGSVGATCNFTVIAGLTCIQQKDFNIITGSSNYGGVG